MRTKWLALLALAMLAGTTATAATVSYGDMAAAARSPAVLSRLDAYDAARGDDALAALVDDDLRRDGIAALSREWLLAQGALRLATGPPGAAGDRILRELAQRPVTLFVEHDHAGHRRLIPAFDVAATARYAIAQRAQRSDAKRLAGAMKSGQALDEARRHVSIAGKQSVARASALAVATVDLETLAASADALKDALQTSPELAAAATAAATRLADESLLVSVIRHGDDAAALAALDAAASLATPEPPLRTIDAAIARADTAAAGLNALADVVATDPVYTPRLLAWLDRPGTAFAAAAAIARLDRPDLAALLADRLDAETDSRQGAALALSLSLMRNDAARRRLEAYVHAPGGIAALKEKLGGARARVQP